MRAILYMIIGSVLLWTAVSWYAVEATFPRYVESTVPTSAS